MMTKTIQNRHAMRMSEARTWVLLMLPLICFGCGVNEVESEPKPEPTPAPAPTPDPAPNPDPEPVPDPTPDPDPDPVPTPNQDPDPDPPPSPDPGQPTPEPEPDPEPEPTPVCSDDSECDDDNACTEDVCLLTGECMNLDMPCADGETCDPATGTCTSSGCTSDVDCDTPERCDTDSGECVECIDNAHCDDADACTMDVCDSTGACVNMPVSCDDNEACDPATGECTPIGCTSDGECDDNNACTVDTCANSGECFNEPVECASGESCNPDTGECEDEGGSGGGSFTLPASLTLNNNTSLTLMSFEFDGIEVIFDSRDRLPPGESDAWEINDVASGEYSFVAGVGVAALSSEPMLEINGTVNFAATLRGPIASVELDLTVNEALSDGRTGGRRYDRVGTSGTNWVTFYPNGRFIWKGDRDHQIINSRWDANDHKIWFQYMNDRALIDVGYYNVFTDSVELPRAFPDRADRTTPRSLWEARSGRN